VRSRFTLLIAGLGFVSQHLSGCFARCADGLGDGVSLGLPIDATGRQGPLTWPEKFELLIDHPSLPVVGHVRCG
jgi:hypothetical protein